MLVKYSNGMLSKVGPVIQECILRQSTVGGIMISHASERNVLGLPAHQCRERSNL